VPKIEPQPDAPEPEAEAIQPEWVGGLLRDVLQYEPVWLKVQATENPNGMARRQVRVGKREFQLPFDARACGVPELGHGV
jgi:hypothetical protein